MYIFTYFRKEVIGRRKAEKRKRSVDSIPNSLSIDVNNYPDASKWNVADVVNFFCKVGFKEQAESFKEQVSVVKLTGLR